MHRRAPRSPAGDGPPDGVEGRAGVLVEGQRGCGEGGVELLGPAGTDDRRGDPRLLEHPGHAGRGQVPAATLAILLQRRHGLELRGVPVPIAVELARDAQGEPGPGAEAPRPNACR